MTLGGPLRPALERRLSSPIRLTAEFWVLAAIVVVAAVLRFWDLGSMALHHDESIHAQWSWKLLQGDYVHSPVFHGPFYYHFQGLIFFLFGTNDYTSRVSAAITGIAVIFLVLLLRRWLGTLGMFSAMAFLGLSPTVVYYSRFFREDIYFAFFTLLSVAAMCVTWMAGATVGSSCLPLGLAGAFTTKEAAFLTSAIFLLYLNGFVALDLARDTLRDRGSDSVVRRVALAAALYPYAWAIVSVWPLIGRIRSGAAWTALPRSGDLLILLGTLILPLLSAFLKSPLERLGVFQEQTFDYPAICNAGGADLLRLAGVFAVVGSAAALVGLQWRPKVWAIAAGSSALIYLTLMTSFWTNMDGLCTGAWGSLDYWIAQQEVQRGNQPWFYYLMLMPSYEFLPLVVGIAGVWWSVIRGDAFSRFLVFWIAGMWIALSAAGEKMPWLNTHIALPTALLAGWTISRAWSAWMPQPGRRDAAGALLAVGGVAAASFWFLVMEINGGVPIAVQLLIRVAAVAALAAVFAVVVRRFGRPAVPALTVAVLVGGLSLFSVQTMARAVYERADTPDDLLIYTQSSPDLAEIAHRIDALAAASGKGHDLRIAVDSSNSFSWPWAWYLRDYNAVRYSTMDQGVPEGDWDVLLVSLDNAGAVNEQLASTAPDRYAAPIRYPHRWWFDERYKSALPGTFSSGETWEALWTGVTEHGWVTTWFEFWRDKEPQYEPGSTDAFAYFPANFDPETGVLGIRPLEIPAPSTDDEGRAVFGGLGGQPGQFFAPRDIDIDAEGNLYVIDSTTKRLSKFDGEGNVIAAVDVREDPAGVEDSDPWGVTVLGDGRVAIADTFGWRVRLFSEDLAPLSSFGTPPALEGTPGPFELFGPRDSAVDSLGRIWVTDTGHHRVMVYDADNAFVMQVGGEQGSGPGQFSEPVGIDISDAGEVFVADMYNGRVQILDIDGNYVGEFSVSGWGGTDPSDKPYLRVLSDGRVALSLPLANEVRVYARDGTLELTLMPADPLARPYGVVETAQGQLWVVEGDASRVRRFDIR